MCLNIKNLKLFIFYISHLFITTNFIKKQSLLLLFSAFFIINNVTADTNFQIKFIENKGQWTSEVLFKADIPGGHLFVSKNCLTYYLVDKSGDNQKVTKEEFIKAGSQKGMKTEKRSGMTIDNNSKKIIAKFENFLNKK